MMKATMPSVSVQGLVLLLALLHQLCLGFSPISGSQRFAVRTIVNQRSACPLQTTRSPFTLSLRNYPSSALSAESSGDSETSNDAESDDSSESQDEESSPAEEKKTLWSRVKGAFKKKEDDGLSFKQKLAKAGLSVALSYGWVSNMSYSVTVSLAWYIFSKQTGLSPLAPGQWKNFLAVYAGFYVFNNFIRPLRFALSAGVARYFDNAVNYIQRKTKVSKGVAVFFLVFLANVCGTLAAMSFGISVAAAAAGVPIFPPKS